MRFAPLAALLLVLAPRAAFASPDCPTCTGDFGSLAIVMFVVLGSFALGSRVLRWLRARREHRRTRAEEAAMEVTR